MYSSLINCAQKTHIFYKIIPKLGCGTRFWSCRSKCLCDSWISIQDKCISKKLLHCAYNDSCKPHLFRCQPYLYYSSSNKYSSSEHVTERKLGSLSAAIVNHSSPAIQPYLKLMRIDRPIGM